MATVDDQFSKKIIFSDEAHFHLSGFVNKQNCRIWANDNPRPIVEKPMHLQRETLWSGLWAGGIIGPQRHRKFGPSNGGVPPRSRWPFNRYFVPYVIELYHIIIIKRNDNKFLNNLCFIQNQHRPLKFNHPLFVFFIVSTIELAFPLTTTMMKVRRPEK
jgi:hypothetical protein